MFAKFHISWHRCVRGFGKINFEPGPKTEGTVKVKAHAGWVGFALNRDRACTEPEKPPLPALNLARHDKWRSLLKELQLLLQHNKLVNHAAPALVVLLSAAVVVDFELNSGEQALSPSERSRFGHQGAPIWRRYGKNNGAGVGKPLFPGRTLRSENRFRVQSWRSSFYVDDVSGDRLRIRGIILHAR